MNYRTLGRTGLSVSEIGLGTLPIGGAFTLGNLEFGRGTVADKNSEKMVQVALDAGINFIDTADIYGYGKSEELVGKMAAGKREKVVIATKAGNRGDEQSWIKDFSSQWLLSACDNSLKRLGTDYIDLYLLHTPDADFMFTEEAFAPLNELKKAGKIRFYGVSVGSAEQGLQYVQSGFGDVMEAQFSLCERGAAEELFPAAQHADMGIIVKAPLMSGLLTGKYSKNSIFPETDFRHRLYPRGRLMQIVDVVDFLRPLAEELKLSPVQLALKYCLARGEISTVIPGAKTAGQILENARAADGIPLPVGVLDKIEETVPGAMA